MKSCVEYGMTLHAFEVLRSEVTSFGHTSRRISKAPSIKHKGVTILLLSPFVFITLIVTYTPFLSLLYLLLRQLLIFVIFLQTAQISNHFLFLRILLILDQY